MRGNWRGTVTRLCFEWLLVLNLLLFMLHDDTPQWRWTNFKKLRTNECAQPHLSDTAELFSHSMGKRRVCVCVFYRNCLLYGMLLKTGKMSSTGFVCPATESLIKHTQSYTTGLTVSASLNRKLMQYAVICAVCVCVCMIMDNDVHSGSLAEFLCIVNVY